LGGASLDRARGRCERQRGRQREFTYESVARYHVMRLHARIPTVPRALRKISLCADAMGHLSCNVRLRSRLPRPDASERDTPSGSPHSMTRPLRLAILACTSYLMLAHPASTAPVELDPPMLASPDPAASSF